MALAFYPAVIEAAADGGYGVFSPDLPGYTSGGDTLQETARNAEEALQAHVELLAEHGRILPAPSDLAAIAADPELHEAARLLVWLKMPDCAVRVNITLPEGLLAEAAQERMRRTSL